MKNEIIGASEARAQWKELLDRAVAGEVIKIERGGVTFYLGTSDGLSEGQMRIVNTAMDLGKHIAEHQAKNPTPPVQLTPAIGIDVTPTKKNNSVATPRTLPQSQLRPAPKFCKAGHILASNGKCLQKGCKYA
jgi:hypothetical protein